MGSRAKRFRVQSSTGLLRVEGQRALGRKKSKKG